MKQLIIAEKPSLARSVTAAIGSGSFSKRGGYYENERYIVSYAYGHLFGLKALEDYLPEEKKKQGWSLAVLPFFPGDGRADDYEFELIRSNNGKGKTADAGVKQQFSVLKKLMNREDVGSIVNCGDADREGEVIIRLIIKAGLKKDKPVYRLWLPDQTEETIREELSLMKRDQEYDNLYDEGLCRTIMDWMYGINLSRYLTIRAPGKTVYAVGRVLTPIVKAVADRDEAIENFIPEKYYQAVSETEIRGKALKLSSSKKFPVSQKAEAEDLCRKLNADKAVVTKAEKKDAVKSRGKLFSLSKLQALLAKKYKMAMDSSLAAVQSLYEKGLVTYPRTNTEYLSENEKEKVRQIIERMKDELAVPIAFRVGKEIFDDKKIESHSAIIPTGKTPGQISDTERIVYEEIKNRFFAVFCREECIVEKTEIRISCDGEKYILRGEILKKPGFTIFDPVSLKNELPDLSVGEEVPHDFHAAEKTTVPPKHYTTQTLMDFLKHPFKGEKPAEDENEENDKMGAFGETGEIGETEENSPGNDDAEYRDIRAGMELGTEATRTPIITKAIHYGYISRKGDSYQIEEKGKKMLSLLKRLQVDISLETSVSMQMYLKMVFNGTMDVDDVLAITQEKIRKDFEAGNPDRKWHP